MGAAALVIAGVTKEYRLGWGRLKVRAVADFSIEVAPGQIFGLLGPNGSGKSSILKMAAGLVTPDHGECRIDGVGVGTRGARARLGYQPESGGVYDHLTGRESLEWFGMLGGESKVGARERAEASLAEWDLIDAADRRVGTYSKGMKRRLSLAQALLHQPNVLLLDEPFSGLDPLAVREVGRVLRSRADHGAAILLTSHLLLRVEDVCDAVGVVHRGHLLVRGSVKDVLGETAPRGRALDDVFLAKLAETEAAGVSGQEGRQ
jgi:ABC-2 type transport system ATP-binding protein